MKKSKFFRGYGLLILLAAVLAGCGGGGGGSNPTSPTSSTFNIVMPGFYYYTDTGTSTTYTYSIPSGKTVKFYTLADTSGTTISADSTVYTGTTTSGGSIFQFTLPDSLKNQSRYIYAGVILSGSFDLQGSTATNLQTAVANGQVLFGNPLPPVMLNLLL